MADPTRENETAIDRCDVSVEDGDEKAESRFIIKIICRHGNFSRFTVTVWEVKMLFRCFQDLSSDLRRSCSNACTFPQGKRKECVGYLIKDTK